MLHRFCFFCLLIGMTHLAQAQHLQLLENRGELGYFSGKASYRGDIAPDHFKFNNITGGYYKIQYNDYAGFKLNYEQIHLSSNDSISNNIYAKNRGFFFARQLNDISLTGEFYFTRYLPGNKSYRFTPYLGIGVGYLYDSKPSSFGLDTSITSLRLSNIDTAILPSLSPKKGIIHFPIQIGFKFNLTRRWNIFAEAMYRFALSDELDFFPDGQLLEQKQKMITANKYMVGGTFDEEKISPGSYLSKFQGSRSGKDQFFSVKAGISFNLIKIYGEEKWKPGKRSRLASLKEQESTQDKPGFFGRLKFKRK